MKAREEQIPEIVPLFTQLWPDNTRKEAEKILKDYVSSKEKAAFACRIGREYVGFALCSVRHDYVEGCDTSPVGYLEGIFVREAYRKQGIARVLCEECETWAEKAGCKEFASDCECNNTASLEFHSRMGFSEANRIVCFKKRL